MDLESILNDIAETSKEAFRRKHVMMSFEQYLEQLTARPYSLSRHASGYLRDLFEHFGSYEVSGIGAQPTRRWRLFDDPSEVGTGLVYGHEDVQNRLYEVLTKFIERGRSDRFVMLHGPNGSAKSSMIEAIRNGLETYSRHDEGALYRFSWIFCEAGEGEQLGFGAHKVVEEALSLAEIDDKLITSRIPCEMKDPPFFLLPKRRRRAFFEMALADAPERERERFRWNEFLVGGQLSPKNRVIYECLLRVYHGDWAKVMRHVRVERYFVSHRYRTGAVTIEPQGTIDAGARMLGHGNMSGLPPALQHETLAEAHGDLVDGNAGIVEYSDFFKRNMEANKYLLTTAERGLVNLSGMTIALNLVLFGTSNEKYLVAFKRDPSFTSFKGRFELIRVPYLRVYKQEAKIYERHLDIVSGERHVAPHTANAAALWAVMTRLRRPNPQHWEAPLARVVERLTPIQKARLYERGDVPRGLDDEERKLLVQHIDRLYEEFVAEEEEFEGYADAAYEGRRGASPREVMAMLTEIAVECERDCITPVDLFEALPKLTADRSLYSFLRIPADGAYHDVEALLELVRAEYLRHVAGEVQRASDLVDESEFQRLFGDYVQNVRAWGTREKILNPQTGQMQDADLSLLEEVEAHLGVEQNADEFRSNLMSKVAAFRLSHPDDPIVYEELFSEQFRSLEESFFKERRERILAMVDDALVVQSGGGREMTDDRREAARHLVQRLVADFGYTTSSAIVVLSYFQRHFEMLED